QPTPLRCSAKHPELAFAVAPARSGRAQTLASRRETNAQRPPRGPVSQTRRAISRALPARDRITALAGRLRQPYSWSDAYNRSTESVWPARSKRRTLAPKRCFESIQSTRVGRRADSEHRNLG